MDPFLKIWNREFANCEEYNANSGQKVTNQHWKVARTNSSPSPEARSVQIFNAGHGRSQDFFRGSFTKFLKNFEIKFGKSIMLAFEILIKFSEFSKNFLRKWGKMHYFSIFFKEFSKPCVNFLRVWTKNTISRKF